MSEHVPEFAKGVIDVGVSAKFSRKGGEFRANTFGFEDKTLLASVKRAERGMRRVEKHSAATVVGS